MSCQLCVGTSDIVGTVLWMQPGRRVILSFEQITTSIATLQNFPTASAICCSPRGNTRRKLLEERPGHFLWATMVAARPVNLTVGCCTLCYGLNIVITCGPSSVRFCQHFSTRSSSWHTCTVLFSFFSIFIFPYQRSLELSKNYIASYHLYSRQIHGRIYAIISVSWVKLKHF